MHEIVTNPWALLACVVVRVAVGGLWYSPLLFFRPWLRMSGVSEEAFNRGVGKAIAVDVVLSLILAFVLLHAIRYALPDSKDLGLGLAVSFLNWLGFTVTVQAGMVTYEKKPFAYFAIQSGYQLVTILGMGAILTLWG